MAGVGLPHEAIREQLARGDRPRRADGPRSRRRSPRHRGGGGPAGRRRGRGPRALEAPVTAPGAVGVALAAAAGGLGAIAAREAIVATPIAGRWLAEAVEPLRRAGREGYAPTESERRRLAVLGTAAMLVIGLLVLGPGPAPFARRRGPRRRRIAGRPPPRRVPPRGRPRHPGRRARGRRRARRRSLGARRARVCRGIARGPAGARDGASPSRARPRRADPRRARGAPRPRVGSPRVDSFAAALLSQQLAGGDLATLLRRFAAAAAPIATAPRPTPARRPPRRASPGCWSSRCRPARPCSPSCSSPASSAGCSPARRRRPCWPRPRRCSSLGFAAIRRLGAPRPE